MSNFLLDITDFRLGMENMITYSLRDLGRYDDVVSKYFTYSNHKNDLSCAQF
jgi:hypothetical protein